MPGSSAGMTKAEAKMLEGLLNRIRLVLEAREWSQAELARRLDVRPATVSAWYSEDDRSTPGGNILLKLPKVLGVNGHWLLTGEGPESAPLKDGEDPQTMGAQAILRAMRAYLDALSEEFSGHSGAARAVRLAEQVQVVRRSKRGGSQ